jgi:hypothetical protein
LSLLLVIGSALLFGKSLVVDGSLVFGESLVPGGSLVISIQLPHLICVHLESLIPAIIPTTADAQAPIISVKSVAEYGIDGGGEAIFYCCNIYYNNAINNCTVEL